LEALYCAPGNPGIGEVARLVDLGVTDVAGLVAFARAEAIGLVVPGPEAPLVAGLADACAEAGIACCGPSAAAARLEGSKAFCKEIADACGVPTARWERFESADAARAFVRRRGAPIVVKADGLAAGKGVVVAASVAEAEAAIGAMMEDRALGPAGASVVIEDCLRGTEASLFALCDGTDAVLLGVARDHKRVGAGDTGPNTGGMGAYAPVAEMPRALAEAAMARIVRPVLAEMARRGTPFRGVLFAGLMLTEAGPMLIEFNVRFGDPECQALLLLLESDLLGLLVAACGGKLAGVEPAWRAGASVAVVVAATGYPAAPRSGLPVAGLDAARAAGAVVFQAGTRLGGDGGLESAGGRVLTVCGVGADLAEARRKAYAGVDALQFPGGFCRRDIALSAGGDGE
jgi:phosphoribosylamine--glycine ligase